MIYFLTAEFESYRKVKGFQLHVCRKADPESKGKIENVVGFIKKNFSKYRVYSNIDSWNEQALSWLKRTGNGKIHNITKKRPIEVFDIENNTYDRSLSNSVLPTLKSKN
ncbi:hypothetical protein [Radiobacillus deserti]|uniref:hypothetical protein n=1 Tax=Radiobacillus deserti TaxID=2594883 RepID=UPI001E4D5166|nr:hypothetical protein [Radiobacillus deserti]